MNWSLPLLPLDQTLDLDEQGVFGFAALMQLKWETGQAPAADLAT